MAVLQAVERFGTPNNGWLTRMRARKPRMVAAITLTNKMASGLWTIMTKQEDNRNPVATMVLAHCAFHFASARRECEEVTEQSGQRIDKIRIKEISICVGANELGLLICF